MSPRVFWTEIQFVISHQNSRSIFSTIDKKAIIIIIIIYQNNFHAENYSQFLLYFACRIESSFKKSEKKWNDRGRSKKITDGNLRDVRSRDRNRGIFVRTDGCAWLFVTMAGKIHNGSIRSNSNANEIFKKIRTIETANESPFYRYLFWQIPSVPRWFSTKN